MPHINKNFGDIGIIDVLQALDINPGTPEGKVAFDTLYDENMVYFHAARTAPDTVARKAANKDFDVIHCARMCALGDLLRAKGITYGKKKDA